MNMMNGSNPPAGMFNWDKSLTTGPTLPSSKRLKTEYGPGGEFDARGSNPLTPLLTTAKKPGSLTTEDRLQSTQTSKTLTVNTVRYIPSLFLPQFNGVQCIDLHKAIMPGDIVFNLHCNTEMVSKRYCFSAGRKAAETVLLSLNLATVNYIICGLQKVFVETKNVATADDIISLAHPHRFMPHESSDAKMLTGWFTFFDKVYGSGSYASTSFPLFARTLMGVVLSKKNNDELNELLTQIDNRDTKDTDVFNIIYNILNRRFESGMDTDYDRAVHDAVFNFVHNYCAPNGIFIGSDKQGGQHMEAPNPNTFAPNDYIGVVQVAGKNISACNMWNFSTEREDHVIAGDVLGFVLQKSTRCNIQFELSSNPLTSRTHNAVVEVNSGDLSKPFSENGPWMLTPRALRSVLSQIKKKYSTYEQGMNMSPNFFKFCIANHISKARNVYTGNNTICSNARSSASLIPIEVFMRFGIHRLGAMNILNLPNHSEQSVVDEEQEDDDRISTDQSEANVLQGMAENEERNPVQTPNTVATSRKKVERSRNRVRVAFTGPEVTPDSNSGDTMEVEGTATNTGNGNAEST